MKPQLLLKRTSPIPELPKYGSAGAAGIDFFWPERDPRTLVPGATYKVDLGFAVAVPEGFCLLLAPRSGLGAKYGMRIKNTVGVIDSDYRGNLLAVFTVESEVTIEPGTALLQGLIIPAPQADITSLQDGLELPETSRGAGGFGSTDKTAMPAQRLAPPSLRSTRTFALMELSQSTYDEIAGQMRDAGYDHVFGADGEIDMHGIAVVAKK